MKQFQIATRPNQAIWGRKVHPLCAEFETVFQAVATKAASNRGQCQRLKGLPQLGVDMCERDINGAACDVSLAHVGPCTHTAVACVEVNAKRVQIDVLLDV